MASTVMTHRQGMVNDCQWAIANRTKISYGQNQADAR